MSREKAIEREVNNNIRRLGHPWLNSQYFHTHPPVSKRPLNKTEVYLSTESSVRSVNYLDFKSKEYKFSFPI